MALIEIANGCYGAPDANIAGSFRNGKAKSELRDIYSF
jgi:hypothetical protein